MELICIFCQKICKNKNSHSNHQRTCPLNLNRNYISQTIGRIPWNKGLNKSDPRVAKHAIAVSNTMKGKPSKTIWTEKMRKEKSEWRKNLHKKYPETHPNRKLANNRKKWTYPEIVAGNWFDKNKIEYKRNLKIDVYYPDFVIDKIIIEIDGEYWHNFEKDKKRDLTLQQLGYKIYRIKAKEKIEKRLKEIFNK
jgi:hypothetical protein